MPRTESQTLIRRAGVGDVAGIAALVNENAERGRMLHRSPGDLFERCRDFRVAVDEDGLAGCCGLRIIWADLAEVYALAVRSDRRGAGLGGKLVEAVVEDARELGVRRVMALTYEDGFFGRRGFRVVDRLNLPMKVWSECVLCPKNRACDEIAVVRELDVEPVAVPAPGPSPALSLPQLAGAGDENALQSYASARRLIRPQPPADDD
jgi:amino-acid N-acetyltransferase